jgi:alpha-amylase
MKKICLYFQVHQPMRFKPYRFFNIGADHYYYDDYLNESVMNKVARDCYLPANNLLLKLIDAYGSKIKVTFSITGIAIDQFKLHAPEVLESFQELAKTGCVEFLAETYSHSLIALKDSEEFAKQIELHTKQINELFGYQPKVFRNTELIYSDELGAHIADMGYKAVVTEGAKHVLGWKSPNYLYCNAINPKLKVFLRNYELSDDIAFRFSNKSWPEYPLDSKKYIKWIDESLKTGETANIFIDYETFGEHHKADSGIFEFLESLLKSVAKNPKLEFSTPSELVEELQPVSAIHVPHPISWADEERDLTAWLGNDLQEDAFNRLYSLIDKIKKCNDNKILTDWKYLQASDHFYYMCTKVFSDGAVHAYFNPFNSPYDAYINYMNILSDFIIRVNAAVPENEKDRELATLAAIIYEKNLEIEKYEKELQKLKKTKSVKSKRTKNLK